MSRGVDPWMAARLGKLVSVASDEQLGGRFPEGAEGRVPPRRTTPGSRVTRGAGRLAAVPRQRRNI